MVKSPITGTYDTKKNQSGFGPVMYCTYTYNMLCNDLSVNFIKPEGEKVREKRGEGGCG